MNRKTINAITVTLAAVLLTPATSAGDALGTEVYLLTAATRRGQTSQVRVVLNVEGHLKVAGDGKVDELPLEVTGNLKYHERIIEADAGTGHATRSVRYYEGADAAITIKQNPIKQALEEDHRLLVVAAGQGNPTLFCPHEHLSREELDLVEVIGNSLLLDRLLPNRKVGLSESWSPPEAALAALLGLEAVSQSSVKCKLTEVKDSVATVEMIGEVGGAIGGVSSEIQLNARYTYHLSRQRITALAMALRENRSIGHAAPGLKVTAQLQMAIGSSRPSKEISGKISDPALARLNLKVNGRNSRLKYTSVGGFTLLHDRRWHVIAEEPGTSVLRLVDRGELIAQCKIATPAGEKPGKPLTLDSFRAGVQESLGTNFKRMVGASQTKTPDGKGVFRVVATGVVSELPIQWRYLHVFDTQGQRATLVFTMESSLAERFGAADVALISAFQFGAAKLAEKPKTSPVDKQTTRE